MSTKQPTASNAEKGHFTGQDIVYRACIDSESVQEMLKNYIGDAKTVAESRNIDSVALDSLYTMGYQYYNMGELGNAAKIFSGLAFLEHTNIKYRLSLGGALFEMGDYPTARLQYSYILTLDNKNIDAIYWLFKCLEAEKRPPAQLFKVTSYFIKVANLYGEDASDKISAMSTEIKIYLRKLEKERSKNG